MPFHAAGIRTRKYYTIHLPAPCGAHHILIAALSSAMTLLNMLIVLALLFVSTYAIRIVTFVPNVATATAHACAHVLVIAQKMQCLHHFHAEGPAEFKSSQAWYNSHAVGPATFYSGRAWTSQADGLASQDRRAGAAIVPPIRQSVVVAPADI